MDTKEIKQIIELMQKFDLSEFDIEREGLKLHLKRKSGETLSATPHFGPMHYPVAQPMYTPSPESTSSAALLAPKEGDTTIKFIKSPMVGTFYTASSPGSPPLVKVGDQLSPNSTICIIEAMKVMNEIHAEMSGTVLEILVQNGESIEYGQPLLKIKAA